MDNSKIHYVLVGFSQEIGFRIFSFEGIAADRVRMPFTVKVDLALARRYNIRLQELPLLCRAVLDRCQDGEEQRTFTYTEEDMSTYADCLAAQQLASKNRRPPRRPAPEHVGAAWRAPQP